MKKGKIALLAFILAAVALAALLVRNGTEASTGQAAPAAVALPAAFSDQAKMGERVFNAVCAACHGAAAAGTDVGPPLVHRIYEPSHHGDHAFEMAVANGVRAHHWTFGDMPPQPALTRADLNTVIAYIRELQRANGIE